MCGTFFLFVIVHICQWSLFEAGLCDYLAQDNILQNQGFEESLGGSDWYCVGCTLTQDLDAYAGSYSARITNRQAYWASVSQDVPLQANTRYYFTAFVKLAEMNDGAMWHQVDMLVALDVQGGSTDYKWFAWTPYLRLDQGWQKIGGDFYIDNRVITKFRLYVQVNENGETPVSYLIDQASLVEVHDNPDWKQEANDRIDDLRKSDVIINLDVSGNYDLSNLEIKVDQVSQSFPFGSAIVDGQIAGDTDYNKKYQNTFYGNFNWAVMENALKWRQMEWNKNVIKFPDESIRRLNENGVPVRGHNVYWGVENFIPNWLKSMNGNKVVRQIKRRAKYLVGRYKGQLVHWDVNNEQLHGAWFETKTGNPTILNDMFELVRARDPDAVLFLNDYNVVSAGSATQALVNSAIEVHAATGEVGGIGIQSHITGKPDINAILLRLNVAASAGFPIWITELDITITNDQDKADAYDDLLTLYYSHPDVHGILLWGFSDQHHWRPDAALFEGVDFVPNAAGLRWQEMMSTRWRTSKTFKPTAAEETFSFRGFHGSYTVKVLNNGEEISEQTFDLLPNKDITLDVSV